jgi:hypothetical protein
MANIVRMIMNIIEDMRAFAFVFTIAVVGFANSYYILALMSYDKELCEKDP